MRVGSFLESTDNAYVQGDIVVLGPRIEGDVIAIDVADNQRVTAGQPLIRLEDRDWRARRDAAAAGLAEAEAAIGTYAAQIDQQRAQIAAAEAQLGTAQAEQARAAADASRYGSLATSGYGSRENAERTLADRRKADANVLAAQANIQAAQATLPVIESQARAARARRDTAAAQLVLAESDLANTVIRAPFDGIVGNRAAQIGAHVRVGQNLIAVAPPPDRQWVVANFKETQVARMHPGQPVTLSVDAHGAAALHGHVDSLAPATGSQFSLLPPENATGNFTKIVQRVPVRIALDAGQDPSILRPGLSVEAEVDTRADPTAPRGVFGAAAAVLSGR
ncbi:membrane fusion protein (multidrug efflux system) [Humitalea rosea]|uniref:Membrane fusion protein (Multidrug efflux system) n=1 Tax=Humitalea rosea TaxID=990373 RepID=A0A2W7HXG2_9PROT|nr:HlyD family secretion protein [Humitalea rosea]PZW39266.1 membrane fusion protein (multidrug efflux system) [Humitalea rosea]